MTEPFEDSTGPQMAVDRITSLPKSVLIHILSFLPIQDAIKTELLSKQWKFLWIYLPSLLFRHRDLFLYNATNKRFVAFVEKTLLLCSSSKVKKFGVDFGYQPRYASKINSWTQFATLKGVEELSLEFDTVAEDLVEEKRYKLPQVLYTNSSFKRLRFSMCNIMPKGIVAWNSLKELSIGRVRLKNDVIEKILEGSPMLEILEFYNYGGFSRLHLSNTSVKKLILREFWNGEGLPDSDLKFNDECSDSEDDESDGEHDDTQEEEDELDDEHNWDSEEDEEMEVLEIWAPYLRSLEIAGCKPWIFQLRNLSSLVDATLDYDLKTFATLDCGLLDLESLVHLKRLTLGACTIQIERDKRQAQEKMECENLMRLLEEENEMLEAENTDLNKQIAKRDEEIIMKDEKIIMLQKRLSELQNQDNNLALQNVTPKDHV